MINKKLFLKYIKNPEKFKLKIKPRCLTFDPKAYHRPAAYTSDGFMLPCCWLDDPKNDFGVEYFGLKEEHLRVKNVDSIADIFKSDEWDHFFDPLLNDSIENRMVVTGLKGLGQAGNSISLSGIFGLDFTASTGKEILLKTNKPLSILMDCRGQVKTGLVRIEEKSPLREESDISEISSTP